MKVIGIFILLTLSFASNAMIISGEYERGDRKIVMDTESRTIRLQVFSISSESYEDVLTFNNFYLESTFDQSLKVYSDPEKQNLIVEITKLDQDLFIETLKLTRADGKFELTNPENLQQFFYLKE